MQLNLANRRSTPIKRALEEAFAVRDRLFSVPDLLERLSLHGLKPNKTTLYRELSKMKELGQVEEISLNNVLCYTSAHPAHHHHLICTECKRIACVDSPDLESALHLSESKMAFDTGFTVEEHEVTLFGRCRHCR